jgi:hypothetical protein
MRNEQATWIVGAVVGALDAALVAAVLVAIGAVTGTAFAVVGDLLGLAFVLGPGWLGPAVGAASVLAAGLIGGRAARRGGDSMFVAAIAGVAWLIAVYVVWVFVWTAWGLGISGEIGSAPFLPFYAALLTFAGLLLPAIVFFLPAALLWAWMVGAVLSGGLWQQSGEHLGD